MTAEQNQTISANNKSPLAKPGSKASAGSSASTKKYRELVKENTVNAIQTILEVMETGKPQERLKAAEIILERAQGKPTQPVDAEVSGKLKVDIVLPPGLDDLLG